MYSISLIQELSPMFIQMMTAVLTDEHIMDTSNIIIVKKLVVVIIIIIWNTFTIFLNIIYYSYLLYGQKLLLQKYILRYKSDTHFT